MTETTETEYETVEQEVTRYECDHCGHTYDDRDEMTKVQISEYQFNGFGHEIFETEHYCEDCFGLREAIRREHIASRWRAFGEGFVKGLTIQSALMATAAFSWGVGATMWMLDLTFNESVPLLGAAAGVAVGGFIQLAVVGVAMLVTLACIIAREVLLGNT